MSVVPELPEVETVVRELRPQLEGQRITAVEVSKFALRRKWEPKWEQQLVGRRVRQVRRRGKWIIADLDSDLHLLFHLGMSGQMRVLGSDEPRETHTHLILSLDRGKKQLRFRDIRRFGSATLFISAAELDQFFDKAHLGPEPFGLDGKYVREQLAGTKRCLKAVLLDQQVIAGVGNIYADESLWTARLHPAQRGCETTAAQVKRLCAALEAVLTRAIAQRGSSIRNYVGGSGLKGQYQEEFAVYGQTGKPCRRCKNKIERLRLAGRSTHFCPRCQKQP